MAASSSTVACSVALLAHAYPAEAQGDSVPAAPRCLFQSRGKLLECVLQILGRTGDGMEWVGGGAGQPHSDRG
eukprot:14575040-Alexandrium_andersonii.AAC.1